MTKKDKALIVEGLNRICADVAALAAILESGTSGTVPHVPLSPTYEQVRAVLAEKARTGYRAEVKSLLTKHGVKQLSEITDPAEYAVLMKEAEAFVL